MKIELTAGVLTEAIAFVTHAIETQKLAVQILGAVAVEVTEAAIIVATNNFDMAAAATVEAPGQVPGRTAVPAKALAALLRGFDKKALVSLTTDGTMMAVRSGSGRYRLPAFPPDEIPPTFAPGKDAHEVSLTAEEVKRLFGTTAFAISSEKTRFYLCGVYLHRLAGQIAVAATDGVVLAKAATERPGEPFVGVIIPEKMVAEILRLGAVTLRFDEKILEARADGRCVRSKLIDGSYPDYARVIPAPSSNHVELDRAALLAGLARLAAVVDKRPVAGLAWHAGEKAMRLCLPCQESAASDVIEAVTSGEGSATVSIPRLVTLLEEIGADRVQLDVGAQHEPMRITVPNDKDSLALLMQMIP